MRPLGWDPSMEDDDSGRQVQCRECDLVYEPGDEEEHLCEDRIPTAPEGVPVTMADLMLGGGRW